MKPLNFACVPVFFLSVISGPIAQAQSNPCTQPAAEYALQLLAWQRPGVTHDGVVVGKDYGTGYLDIVVHTQTRTCSDPDPYSHEVICSVPRAGDTTGDYVYRIYAAVGRAGMCTIQYIQRLSPPEKKG